MKKGIFAIMFSALLVSWALAGDKGAWFDMENCEMCKPLMENTGLMEHMTWEHHKVSNGNVSITKVEKEWVTPYKKAGAKMDETAQRWMSGEKVTLCNMCRNFGAIMQAGAKSENVESDNTFIWITYSDDPEVVKKIHKWTDRTNSEMKALAKGENPAHRY